MEPESESGGERSDGGFQAGHLGQRVPDAAEFAGIAKPVLQPSKDPGNVPDIDQKFPKLRQPGRVAREFTDEILPPADFGNIEGGRSEPAFQQSDPA
jgi:hypothetical protein